MHSAFFSIIVPVYNKEKYLKRCLESLKCQTFKDFEVILVDDKSQDNSVEIIYSYVRSDSRFSIIHNETNMGVSLARNIGMNASVGQWLLFVDADDYLTENALSEIQEVILNNDKLEAVLFNGDFVDNGGNVVNDFYQDNIIPEVPVNKVFRLREYKLMLHYVNAALLCLNKNFAIKHSIRFTGNMRHEDWDFMWKVFACDPLMLYLPSHFYKYVIANDGYTSSQSTVTQSMDLFKAYENGVSYFQNSQLNIKDYQFYMRIVAFRHFWDFFVIKVSICNDAHFKKAFVNKLVSFIHTLSDDEFLEIVNSDLFTANRHLVVRLRNSRCSIERIWILNKTSPASVQCVQEIRQRYARFMILVKTCMDPLRVVFLLLKYLKIQVSGIL